MSNPVDDVLKEIAAFQEATQKAIQDLLDIDKLLTARIAAIESRLGDIEDALIRKNIIKPK